MSWWNWRHGSSSNAAIAELNTAKRHIDRAIALIGSTPVPPEPDDVIPVVPGDNLLDILAQAPAGATLRLDPTYVCDIGAYTFVKPVTLISGATLPPTRVSPSLLGPQLCDASVTFAAPDVTWQGLRVYGRPDGTIITAGPTTTLDRCVILGNDDEPQHRGVAVNAADILITGCHIGNIWHTQDTQAICGWDGTARLRVWDCFLEASGENFMLGGADAASAERMPHDVMMDRCTLSKPVAWMTKAGCTAKNLLELKAVRWFTLRDSRLEYSWAQGQAGFAIVLTIRNQNGQAVWSTIEDVLIEGNTIAHVAAGFSVLGRDDEHESQRMQRVTIRKNTIEDLSRTWAVPGKDAAGRQYQISGGPLALTLEDNNTNLAPGDVNAAILFDQVKYPVDDLVVRNCELYEGSYGINGQADVPLGTPQLDAHCPNGYTWEGNTLQRGTSGRVIAYPPGTTVLPPVA